MKSGTVHDSANRERISSKYITDAIAMMLTTSQVDDTSKSMRKGGLSTGKRTGLPRALRCRQSGQEKQRTSVVRKRNGTDTESNQDSQRCDPPEGLHQYHLYRFSQMFGL